MDRFHIVVSNYRRLFSFIENFHKIRNFDPLHDKVYITDCSPEEEWGRELESAKRLESCGLTWGENLFFIRRRNWAGNIGSILDYYRWALGGQIPATKYGFFMQEHYLDTERFVNCDCVPDDYHPDLDKIDEGFASDPQIGIAFASRLGIRISVLLPFLIPEPPAGLEGREYAPFSDSNGRYLHQTPEGGVRQCFFPDGATFIVRTETLLDYFRSHEHQLIEGNGSFGFAVAWELRLGKILMDSGSKWMDLYNKVAFRTLEDVDAIEATLQRKISALWIANMNWIFYYGYDLLPEGARSERKNFYSAAVADMIRSER